MSSRMNILLLGGGGREHAIAAKLLESDITKKIYCAPGNAGMDRCELIGLDIADPAAVVRAARELEAGLVVCGPEGPLAAGVGDAVREAGIPFFGPGRSGAMLESSKVWAKYLMNRHGVPTAAFDFCKTMDECRRALSSGRRRVVKADGLAAGKGVFLPETADEALAICDELIGGRLLVGAGHSIVIEDFTEGQELSVFAVTDGDGYEILTPSRDHKRAYDGDEGPNTGGMGAFAPVTIPDGVIDKVKTEVLERTLEGLKRDGIDYRGLLYMGLMITPSGDVSVIEFNARFGDPETQAVLPLYEGDLGELMLRAATGRLDRADAGRHDLCALAVVLAAEGYPGSYERGMPITGLDADAPDTYVYHAGTARGEDGSIVTAGGRVLCVTGVGSTFEEARERAYGRADAISFKGMRMRRDIGWSEMKR